MTTAPVFEDGSYTVSFDMGIPSGGSGYFNMGNSGDPNNWQWEFEVYFNSDGTGYTTQSYELFNYDSGVIAVEVNIDLDAGLGSVSIDGVNGSEIVLGSLNEVSTNGNWPKVFDAKRE